MSSTETKLQMYVEQLSIGHKSSSSRRTHGTSSISSVSLYNVYVRVISDGFIVSVYNIRVYLSTLCLVASQMYLMTLLPGARWFSDPQLSTE